MLHGSFTLYATSIDIYKQWLPVSLIGTKLDYTIPFKFNGLHSSVKLPLTNKVSKCRVTERSHRYVTCHEGKIAMPEANQYIYLATVDKLTSNNLTHISRKM